MAPIPSPYFPEPIKVANNVSDGDYDASVRFVRMVGLAHLASVTALAALVSIWEGIGISNFLNRNHIEFHWLAVIAVLALLAWLRRAHTAVQSLVFLVFAIFVTAGLALWIPLFRDIFPDLSIGFGAALSAAWLGLAAYNLLSGRDYSFVGEFTLVWLFMAATQIVLALRGAISPSQAVAIQVVSTCGLFYWVYDLAMVLRRRTADEPVAAVFDLYRDVLNFVGFPIRVIRMHRGRKKVSA